MSLFIKDLSNNIVALLEELQEHKNCHSKCGCNRFACIYDRSKSNIQCCRKCKNVLCVGCIEERISYRRTSKYRKWICRKCDKERVNVIKYDRRDQ